jgi:hypothetical protein
MQPGSTPGAQIDNACAALSGSFGVVIIPSTMAAGWSGNPIPSNCILQDYRAGGSVGSGMVPITAYGAYGDDSHDDAGGLQACINAAESTHGSTCYVPNGIYRLSTAGIISSSTALKCQSASAILKINSSASPHNNALKILSTFAATKNLSGAFTAGQTQFTVPSTTGLAVGQDVFMLLGQDPYDATQNFTRMFNQITAIAGSVVTLAVGLPEAVAAPSSQTSTMNTFATEAQNIEVSGCGFDIVPGQTADESITIDLARNVHIHDVVAQLVDTSFIGPHNSENINLENIYIVKAAKGSNQGGGITTWGVRNLSIKRLWCGDCIQLVSSESQGRGGNFEDLYWGASTGAVVGLSFGGNSIKNHVHRLTTNAQSYTYPIQVQDTSEYDSDDIEIPNVAGAMTGGLHMEDHYGKLLYQGVTYNRQRVITIPFTILPSQSSALWANLPSGFYTSVQFYMSSTTGITFFDMELTSGAAGTGDIKAALINGGAVDFAGTAQANSSGFFGLRPGIMNGTLGPKRGLYNSDGTVPPNTWGYITITYYPDPASEFSNTNGRVLAATTASIGGSALTAGTCAIGTATVTGATNTMGVSATPQTYPGDAFTWKGYVSATNTVTVKVCTNLAAGGTPTASLYNVRVTQ